MLSLLLLWLVSVALAIPQNYNAIRDGFGPKIEKRQSSSYWMANIQHQGQVAYGTDPNYKIWRNVRDYGATGDGSTDDTNAIMKAMTDGNRCGQGCDSSTTTPAIVYFPAGTYMISSPIVMYYYTQLIGDGTNMPTIKALPSFTGLGLLDSDVYIPGANGAEWYTNQNNFFRQVRNLIIDMTALPESDGNGGGYNGIHWQVAQGASLQNVVINMKPKSPTNKQMGIFSENGSGMFMGDVVFNGGNVGASFGGQQFTMRNLTFNGCNTAILLPWDWLWTLKSITVTDCDVGLDISALDYTRTNQTVGSAILMDSSISATKAGVLTSYNATSAPEAGGTLLLHNVDFTNTPNAIMHLSGNTILKGGARISQWGQGNAYLPPAGAAHQKRLAQMPSLPYTQTLSSTPTFPYIPSNTNSAGASTAPYGTVGTGQVGASSVTYTTTVSCTTTTSVTATVTVSPIPISGNGSNSTIISSPVAASQCSMSQTLATATKIAQQLMNAPAMPSSLLNADGTVFERSKPQYLDQPVSNFVSIKTFGAKGDGLTDDTDAFQKALDSVTADQILYVDHGAYLITRTVNVTKGTRITGEIWPLIMISGEYFSDVNHPKPGFSIGNPGDSGTVEISDLIFETRGAAPGAIIIEWNIQETSQGSAGMWDTHVRIGGSAGTELQADTCIRQTAGSPSQYNPACAGSFMMMHVTQTATGYFENTWFWVADHELDIKPNNQTNIFNGRGVLVESQGPVWLWGTSSEHSQLYNYQIANAKQVFMGAIQGETAYMQGASDAAEGGFVPNPAYSDPDFADCTTSSCKKTWGLRVVDSSDIYMFGAGLYSFFDDYLQDCLDTESCQLSMVDIECSTGIYLYGLVTKAATNQVVVDGQAAVLQKDNPNVFGATVLLYEQQ